VLIVLKFGSLKLLELSGPVEACNGIALPFTELVIFNFLLSVITEWRAHEELRCSNRAT
jgi:hypothetical protein